MPAVSIPDTTSTLLVVDDMFRTTLLISNSHATSNLHINFGGTATTNDAYLPAGGNMTLAGDRLFKGQINAISSSGTIVAKYSKGSPGT